MRWLVVPVLAVGVAGCVSSGDITLLHREITDVSRQVENLGRQSTGKEDLNAMTRKLADQNAQVLKSNADIRVDCRQFYAMLLCGRLYFTQVNFICVQFNVTGPICQTSQFNPVVPRPSNVLERAIQV